MSEEKKQGTGLRFNDNKLRVDLIPVEWEVELARVHTAGSYKYFEKNWEKGMDWNKVFASMRRHILLWRGGQDIDEETKCHHLAMVAWNALALMTYQMRQIGTDFRDEDPMLYNSDFSPIEGTYGDDVGLGLSPEEIEIIKKKFAHLREAK